MIKTVEELNNEIFEVMEFFDGVIVLMTCRRIDRAIIPEGLFAYDLRHDDESQGDICEIKPFVLVNHWGTIISKVPIEMNDEGYRLVYPDDYAYQGGETMTIKEFIEKEVMSV